MTEGGRKEEGNINFDGNCTNTFQNIRDVEKR